MMNVMDLSNVFQVATQDGEEEPLWFELGFSSEAEFDRIYREGGQADLTAPPALDPFRTARRERALADTIADVYPSVTPNTAVVVNWLAGNGPTTNPTTVAHRKLVAAMMLGLPLTHPVIRKLFALGEDQDVNALAALVSAILIQAHARCLEAITALSQADTTPEQAEDSMASPRAGAPPGTERAPRQHPVCLMARTSASRSEAGHVAPVSAHHPISTTS